MPVRDGGLGIRFVADNADQSYISSSNITLPLVKEIIKQSNTLPDANTVKMAKISQISLVKEQETARSEEIKSHQTPDMQRILNQYSEPGASSWLGALPIAAQGFNLNKGEFQDALC